MHLKKILTIDDSISVYINDFNEKADDFQTNIQSMTSDPCLLKQAGLQKNFKLKT